MSKLSVSQSIIKAKSCVKKGRIEEAKNIYQQILKAFPSNRRAQEGLANLGRINQNFGPKNVPQDKIEQLMSFYKRGQMPKTVTLAQELIKNYPDQFILWNLLGAANISLNQTSNALAAFKKVTELNPDYADGFNNLGLTLQSTRRFGEAISCYKKALSIKPDFADAHNNLGNALKDEGNLKEAIKAYKKAISLRPNYAEAHNNLGVVFQEEGALTKAISCYKKALSIKPDFADAHNNLGNALKDEGNLKEAIKAYKKAISLRPNYAEAHNNLGVVFQEEGALTKAIECYKKAFSIKPNFADAYYNIANTLKEQRKLNEAIQTYKKAISLRPDYVEANYNLSLVYLLNGKLEKGLKLYEWRYRKKREIRTRAPREKLYWNGLEPIKGKRFLVYEEQGLGDIIQFCRYLPLLRKMGADLSFQVTKKLHSLIQTMDGDLKLTSSLPDEKELDFEAPLMSLPFLLNTTIKTIPNKIPYLFANPKKAVLWSKSFNEENFKVGVCWQGSKNKIDVGRSFPLSLFEGISRLENVELISLHKGEGEKQINDIKFNLTTLGDDFDVGEDSFIDTTAVMVSCDLIISSDTAIAHLAGALGKPTWVALKYIPDWRWMLEGDSNPWYPTVKLYRQRKQGDWQHVFDSMRRDLKLCLEMKRN